MLKMLSQRCQSTHNYRFNLTQVLRKERQLSNRVNVLMIQKNKKLKHIEKQIKYKNSLQDIKLQRTFFKEKSNIKQLHLDKKIMYNKSLKKQIQIGIKLKKQNILDLNQQKFKQIKKLKQQNEIKIALNRSKNIQSNKTNKNRIKLMQINCKDKITKFWQSKLQYLIEKKNKQNEQKYNLYQNSLLNISILQQKQNKLIGQIENKIQQNNFIIQKYDTTKISLYSSKCQKQNHGKIS